LLLSGFFLIMGVLVYFPGINCEYLFDDIKEILINPAMQTIWPPWYSMFVDNTLPSRPIPYYSFALNYAISGHNTWSYHVVNIMLHACMGMIIYLILRRILPRLLPLRFQSLTDTIALWCSMIWMLHPIQTQSVQYIYQRLEQSWSLCLLLAVYTFLRAIEREQRSNYWLTISVVITAIGMLCKETMIVAPFLLLFFDYCYAETNWSQLWKERSQYHVCMFATIALLYLLYMFQLDLYVENHHGEYSRWDYLILEAKAIGIYLQLTFFPSPLIFDYGPRSQFAVTFRDVWPQFLLVITLLLSSLVGLWRYPRIAFWGLWFFFILGPTSSIMPTFNPICEYRMLLPILAPILLTVLAFVWGVNNIWPVAPASSSDRQSTIIPAANTSILDQPFAHKFVQLVLVVLAVLCGQLSWQRSQDYRNFVTLWEDNRRKVPANFNADIQLGAYYFVLERYEQARNYLLAAYEKKPDDQLNLINLGVVEVHFGRYPDAIRYYEAAANLPNPPGTLWEKLGKAFVLNQQPHEAIQSYRTGLKSMGPQVTMCLALARLLASEPAAEKEQHRAEIAKLVSNVVLQLKDDPIIYEEVANIYQIYGDEGISQKFRDMAQQLKTKPR
jgi:hypothetical protein